MFSDDSKGLHKLLFERICQIQEEILTSDPEYKELGKVPTELFNQLFHKLPGRPGDPGPIRLRPDGPVG